MVAGLGRGKDASIGKDESEVGHEVSVRGSPSPLYRRFLANLRRLRGVPCGRQYTRVSIGCILPPGGETHIHPTEWNERWVEDKVNAAEEDEISNCLCLMREMKRGYSVSLLWFKRNVIVVRIFIILGDVLTFGIFLWVLVFATYLLTDPAIEKQHIIGIINNDTMPYPPQPDFDIQEHISTIVAYHLGVDVAVVWLLN
ncbi:unnamed protein product [Hydatigera taeniaeformis]|uniref:Neur_chan_memb domain-containing protein n=1 Tax=Hydatigena taeniaeformis TaxID=6205 RepID=A0A0R3WS81_HYDTA|nr:unnamed protein product [Hydatigera taeniaeformis]